MKRVLLTFMVIVAGLAMTAPDASAQSGNRNGRAGKGQDTMDAWKKDMAEFRARSEQDRKIRELTDSIAAVQAFAAVKNQDFVLEAQTVSFKNGANVFVNSTTNFISVKGNRAVVQISPSNFASGPNGGRYDFRPGVSRWQEGFCYVFLQCDGNRNQCPGGDISDSRHQQRFGYHLPELQLQYGMAPG